VKRSQSNSSGKRIWLYLIVVFVLLAGVALAVYASLYRLARDGALDNLVPLVASPSAMAAEPVGGAAPSATPLPTVAVSPTTKPQLLIITATPSVLPGATGGPTEAATEAASPATALPMPGPTLTPIPQPTTPVLLNRFVIESPGCVPHGAQRGTVKGQIFDRNGGVIAGAEVRVTLNDWAYDVPAVSNGEGWYEFYLDNGLEVKIISLRIAGEEMTLVGAERVFEARAGCFEHVNLRRE